MSKHTTDIVAYIGPIGFIIAYLAGDRTASRFHLNQALILCIAELVLSAAMKICSYIPLLGTVVNILLGFVSLGLFVLWIISIAGAIQGEEKPAPVIGGIHLL